MPKSSKKESKRKRKQKELETTGGDGDEIDKQSVPTTTNEGEDEDTSENDNNNNSSSSNGNVDDNDDGEEDGILTKTPFSSLPGLHPSLLSSIASLKWTTASRIQADSIPPALEGRDVIGLAETGSGKTGAFSIPVLNYLLEKPQRAVFAVILAPTRELAFQIHEVIVALGRGMGATSVCVVGGVDMASQAIALARNPHIVVATPGRLLDHLQNTKGFHLRQIKYLVLDEADRMLSMDFEREIHEILEVIPDHEKGRRTMLFSATMTSKVDKLQRASLVNPIRVEVSTKFQTPKKLLQSYLFIPAKYKDCYLTYLINEHAGQSVLVFGATCNNVQRLALMLRNLGFPAICLHGQMSQPKRLGALTKFKSGGRDILICTDVASRGLDIPSVDVVINFDLPGHGKDYIHRVGRTARAGRSGKAIAMVTQYDVEVYQRLEHLLGQRLPEYKLAEEEVLLLLERVNEAQRLATREVKEQLSTREGNRKSRNKKSKYNDEDGDGDGEAVMRDQMKHGFYAGGSGGRGGGFHNQRGGGAAKRKKYRR
mmetsp:Transcript_40710/g.69514  ORF Transcript_40710/g.69514 Transcript_40710/m.69514 type:complete len:541 (+) Transcript_40710:157-1779(+)|eukprot:CAMPEP_0183763804 /NCGR_PEP_ID=MMETSP0739-20130205/9930_1 /TAXON_ID=385413 /ORGANISM="Thalassiosira miniscula, Strain CCMP1093" /LENGTH=540 /DNA_ID=CAMNT_0026002269 /DNA_START=137 /DNA_END=1759 /DNA_ORIENTATION=+